MTKFETVKQISQHPAISKPRAAYAKRRYSTPLFVLRETLSAFQLHNGLGLSASLSFYAMFALIPMVLLMFFLLSHLVISSDYAIVKLAILTSNLVPKLSSRIMLEVYNVSQHKAVWGIFGIFALFWVATPLAAALRSSFYTISSVVETPSFIRRKLKDAFAVLGMLLLFFLFTFSGLVLDKIIAFLQPTASHSQVISALSSLVLTTLLVSAFYRMFFPARVAFSQILFGSLVTTLLWLAIQPAFNLFLSFNESYGSMFGGLKNMFISIGWLYYTFIVFLFGTVLISTMRKKDVLLLRGLFTTMPKDKENYLLELMERYGETFKKDDYIFKQGDHSYDLYYVTSGTIHLLDDSKLIRELSAGDYFGEMALLTDSTRIADALVSSEKAEVIVISAQNIETLLLGEPKVAMNFLKQMALRLHHNQTKTKA